MTASNVLKSLHNISKSNHLDVTKSEYASNDNSRIQATGAGLEIFIRDSFCGIPGTIKNRNVLYEKIFSWLGAKNNPPDAMLKMSDAIEIKKHEGRTSSDLALNSSPPRATLNSDDNKISAACKNSETIPWKKDNLYALGTTVDGKIKEIMFCYGDCFIANSHHYEKPVSSISETLTKLQDDGMKIVKTNELGKIRDVDPLSYSVLRIRGMWHLKSPRKIFENEIDSEDGDNLRVIAIMKKEKYDGFPENDKSVLFENSFKIKYFTSPNPNNITEQIDLVVISFCK